MPFKIYELAWRTLENFWSTSDERIGWNFRLDACETLLSVLDEACPMSETKGAKGFYQCSKSLKLVLLEKVSGNSKTREYAQRVIPKAKPQCFYYIYQNICLERINIRNFNIKHKKSCSLVVGQPHVSLVGWVRIYYYIIFL